MNNVDNRSEFPEDPAASTETFATGHGPQSGAGAPGRDTTAEDPETRTDRARREIGDRMGQAAGWLSENTDHIPGGETPRRYARQAADGIREGADYIRRHDVKDMTEDVERVVRNHPVPSLLAVAAVGFLLGRAFRNG